jgi:citrate lyase subunit beta/citryl-CoA lyase
MNPYYRPRRSMLYVPGCNNRYLHKARTLKVDSVILDLGDPILVEAKEQSRKLVAEAVLAGGYGRREVVVRVNDLDSPWGHDDVKAVAGIGADAVLFPNVESKADVQEALSALDAAGGQHLPIMLMIESPLAVLRAEEIASASDRIACLVMATSDLLNQLHGRRTPDRIAVMHSLSARAARRARARPLRDRRHLDGPEGHAVLRVRLPPRARPRMTARASCIRSSFRIATTPSRRSRMTSPPPTR